MKFLYKYSFLLIFILALVLRFYNLGTNPPSLTWDEAAWGYNAFTLAHTGHDEFGKFLPITYLESFGDFKPPMYAYLSILPVGIMGMSEFSTRFVSALFGSLTVLITYFLVLELFYKAKHKRFLALGSSLLLAISPWHILLSRAAFEANVATFFIVTGVWLFLYVTRDTKKRYLLILSFLSFVAATYTFNTSRVFLPIFVPLLLLYKWRYFIMYWKTTIVSLVISGVVFLPLFFFLLTPQAKLRYQEVNIFSDIQVIERVNQEAINDNNSKISSVIHNRRLAYAVEYVKHYLDNLDPGFLFIHGDGNPKFSIQDVGEMYIWELPFLIGGAILLFRKREGNWLILPVWFILGIVPAATARETPHALRIETILPVPQILVTYGLYYAYKWISDVKFRLLSIKIKYVVYGIFWIVSGFTFLYFVHTYFVHYPATYASEWQYGYKDAVKYAEDNKNKFDHIYVTNALGRPYIYFLLYGGYPPETLKNANITREALGFVHVNQFGKYSFFDELPYNSLNTLYINVPSKVPPGANIVQKFLLPNGQAALVAYTK